MAKKARKKTSKKTGVKRKKKTKVSTVRKSGKPAVKKSKAKSKAKRAGLSKPQTFGQRVSSAFSVVTDTISGTRKLRDKMEPPATSETE